MNAEQDLIGLRRSRFSFDARVVFFAGVVSSTAMAGPIMQFRTVAKTGMAAPGTEPGVVFDALTTPISHDLMIPKSNNLTH